MRGLYPAGADCARRARRGLYPAVADCTRRARRGLYCPAAQMLRIRRACRGDQVCYRPSGVSHTGSPRPSCRGTEPCRTAPRRLEDRIYSPSGCSRFPASTSASSVSHTSGIAVLLDPPATLCSLSRWRHCILSSSGCAVARGPLTARYRPLAQIGGLTLGNPGTQIGKNLEMPPILKKNPILNSGSYIVDHVIRSLRPSEIPAPECAKNWKVPPI